MITTINEFKEHMDKTICGNCDWSWTIESDDKNPELCHKCGYDNLIKDFDLETFQQWKDDNNIT
jgi:ribosomal protein L40E